MADVRLESEDIANILIAAKGENPDKEIASILQGRHIIRRDEAAQEAVNPEIVSMIEQIIKGQLELANNAAENGNSAVVEKAVDAVNKAIQAIITRERTP